MFKVMSFYSEGLEVSQLLLVIMLYVLDGICWYLMVSVYLLVRIWRITAPPRSVQESNIAAMQLSPIYSIFTMTMDDLAVFTKGFLFLF